MNQGQGVNSFTDKILILDFGSQTTQLIARRIREKNIYCAILQCNTPMKTIFEFNPKGLVFSGGPASVYDKNAPVCDPEVLKLNVPILGICYGMQWLTNQMGGKVIPSNLREYGKADLLIDDDSDLFDGVLSDASSQGRSERSTTVWMSHGDRIEKFPEGFQILAHTQSSPTAAMRHKGKDIYGLQFHPEVVHTQGGARILHNFLFKICRLTPSWTMESYCEKAIESIRESVGDEGVVCALSGGVDSAVAATLVHRAIGDRLTCIFVDNGLLRQDEGKKVLGVFRKNLKLEIRYVNAASTFLKKLKGVTDPEKKRRIIGREFIRTFETMARELGHPKYLVQGTLYPDWIESTSFHGAAATIKTHHNVGGLPKRMRFTLVEPLRELFKDEVRRLGLELGIPDPILFRHPFPGPGLAVRIIGELNRNRLDLLRRADVIVEDEIRRADLYSKVWQAFPVLLPIKTVGVMGDERTYEYAIALRVVQSQDGMTADWVRVPYDVLEKISNRIINEVRGINRVVYDISSKPPSTIEWE